MHTAAAYLREGANDLEASAKQRREMIADLQGKIAALEDAARTFEDDARELRAAACALEGTSASMAGADLPGSAGKVAPPRDW